MNCDEPITLNQAGELLDLSQAQVSRLVADEWIARNKSTGKTTPRLAVSGYIKSIKKARVSADTDLKAIRAEDYRQRMDARAGKYQAKANAEAYALCMEAWPPVVAFLDGLPAQFSRDNETRIRVHKAIDQFKTKFIAHIKTLEQP